MVHQQVPGGATRMSQNQRRRTDLHRPPHISPPSWYRKLQGVHNGDCRGFVLVYIWFYVSCFENCGARIFECCVRVSMMSMLGVQQSNGLGGKKLSHSLVQHQKQQNLFAEAERDNNVVPGRVCCDVYYQVMCATDHLMLLERRPAVQPFSNDYQIIFSTFRPTPT